MGLFDIFRFKKDAQEVFSTVNVESLLEFAKETIIEQAKKNISGTDKKTNVDYAVIKFIIEKTKNCSNSIVKWLIDKLIEAVPKLTQIIYDFLKAKIENL